MNAKYLRAGALAAAVAVASAGLTWTATDDIRERTAVARSASALPVGQSPVSGDRVRGLHEAAKEAGAVVSEWGAQVSGDSASWEVTLSAAEPAKALRGVVAGLGERWGAWSLTSARVDPGSGEVHLRAVTHGRGVG